MPPSGSVSGSRQIRRNSKKHSKNGSKRKSNKMDFSSLLDDMESAPMNQQNQGYPAPAMPGMQMPAMPGMSAMPGMGGMPEMQMPAMPGMQMPGMAGMGMDPFAMAQMAAPNMGMPQMTMGNGGVDPLHLQHFVPQTQHAGIDNFGVSPNQLMSSAQIGQQYKGMANQSGGGRMFSAYDSFVSKFM